MFSEKACAEAGTPQELMGIGKSRVEPALIVGGPKAPVRPLPPTARVSATRQGVKG